jgi:two-component system cell cycle sensor histidine kinase/response regulator CckA
MTFSHSNGLDQHQEEALDRYATLLDRTGYGVFRATPDGHLIDGNAALATILGHANASELRGRNLVDEIFLNPIDGDALLDTQTVTGFSDWVTSRWKRRDGSPITVRVAALARVDGNRVVEIEGIVDDITDRQRRDELLRRTERMAGVGATLAGVAHELNNPLAAIIGFAQLLLKRPLAPDDRTALEAINHEALRSANVVRNLLAMVRRRDGERRVATNINDVVGYIARTRRYALETAGIACRVDLDPALPLIRGDRAQLEQVMLNLVRNAEQALLPGVEAKRPTPAWIHIRTGHDDSNVIIEVQDNGPGISETEAPRIWDAFWTTKDEGDGTGLGLSVAQSIIVDHGGTITLEKTSTQGAEFVIRIPIAHLSDSADVGGKASRALDVLVVESAAEDGAFVERFLASRGHAVICAGTPEAAVTLASRTGFDVILCDAHLKLRDGRSVAEAVRAATNRQSRLVLSAPPDMDADSIGATIENAITATRPYDVEELRRLIEGD